MDVKSGEIHAVIGPNGAGKSTLISQICGTLAVDDGQVALMGRKIDGLDACARVRAGIGRTFQISALAMEDTVLENVVLGALGASGNPWRFFINVLKDKELVETAKEALERTGLFDLRNRKTATLSHGQRRQLEVAVALTLKPKIFIMDEPMAGLGAEGSKNLTKFLGKLKHQAPILMVEHDMDAVFALADRITVLDYGRVIASDHVEAIRTNKLVKEAYLGADK